MPSETYLWAFAVPLISLALLVFSIVFRLSRRQSFSIQLKGLGVELKVSSKSLDVKDSHKEPV